jgi:hypothetical protein
MKRLRRDDGRTRVAQRRPTSRESTGFNSRIGVPSTASSQIQAVNPLATERARSATSAAGRPTGRYRLSFVTAYADRGSAAPNGNLLFLGCLVASGPKSRPSTSMRSRSVTEASEGTYRHPEDGYWPLPSLPAGSEETCQVTEFDPDRQRITSVQRRTVSCDLRTHVVEDWTIAGHWRATRH